MSEQSAKMTYRLPDGTETTYLVELQPESDYSIMDKKFYLAGIEAENERILGLLEEHVWQLDVRPDGKWKQRCRCGFYGVFNNHLIALIKGEK
jgi:hypothetical protein